MSYLDRVGKEVLAFAVMEAASEPSKPYNVKVVENKGIRYVTFDSRLQSFGVRNRNGNKYAAAAVMEGIAKSELIQDQLQQGGWPGESGHPMMTSTPERICQIDPNNISHAITKHWMSNNGMSLEGSIMTIDDNGGAGTRFTNQTLQGMHPTFSLRALAVFVTEGDGTRVCGQKCRPVCYDRVIGPSHADAKINTGASKRLVFSDESFNQAMESTMVAVTESFINNYIREESKRINIAKDNFELAMESMQYDPKTGLVYASDEGRQFAIPVEKHLQHEVRDYLSKL